MCVTATFQLFPFHLMMYQRKPQLSCADVLATYFLDSLQSADSFQTILSIEFMIQSHMYSHKTMCLVCFASQH